MQASSEAPPSPASAPAMLQHGWPEPPGPCRSLAGGLQRACKLGGAAGWLLRGHVTCQLPDAALLAPASAPPRWTADADSGLDRVADGLYISSGRAASRLASLRARGVTHVVNAAPSVELCWHEREFVRGRGGLHARRAAWRVPCPLGGWALPVAGAVPGTPLSRLTLCPQAYLTVDVLDGPEELISAHFERMNLFVGAARAAGGVVLVHCHSGVSRAAALVCAYLIAAEGLSYDEALARLRAVRPFVSPNPGFAAQLRTFEAGRRHAAAFAQPLPCFGYGDAFEPGLVGPGSLSSSGGPPSFTPDDSPRHLLL